MDNNTNKLINNGYLRTPYITKNNGHGSNTTNRTNNPTDDDRGGGGGGGVGSINNINTATVISPLLGAENKSELSETEVMHHSSTPTSPPPQSQQQPLISTTTSSSATPASCANNVGHMKYPTVVYLGTDSGKPLSGIGPNSNATRTSLQHNAPPLASYISTHSPHSSTPHQSEWLLKESTLRCRLLVLAVALTVLGAAIGALAIYFAGNYRCQTATATATTTTSRNINNVTGKCQNQMFINC